VCIPWNGIDLDCGDIPHRRFRVITPPAPFARDPHGFDGDADGVGCVSG
jgi:micrococcal nuclease